MKYANYLILGFLLLCAVLLKDSIHISTNLLSLFAPKESLEKLSIANELGYSKEMFVLVKGFDKKSKKTLKALVKEFKNLDEIQSITYKIKPSQEIQKYYREYHSILADFDNGTLSEVTLKQKLKKLYDGISSSVVYRPIDKSDPLNLFTIKEKEMPGHKGKYITIGKEGYLLKITTKIEPSQMDGARLLYTKVEAILKNYPETVAFAPFFYSVENSAKIKGDVTFIVVLSTILLLLIYLVMLRDIKLLSHTFTALVSSMLFATLVCTTLVENFGVLSLAFGTTLTAVSIDYFFHYYFHGFYQSKKRMDISVFYGFVTTIVAFGVFALMPVAMIAQISLFALLSLSFAYVLFTFVFPYLEIKPCKSIKHESKKSFVVSSVLVSIVSVLLLVYSVLTISFDTNVRNLDYQNTKLQKLQKLFSSANTHKLYPVIVQAKNREKLLETLYLLKDSQNNSFSFSNFIPQNKQCLEKVEKFQKYDFVDLNFRLNKEAKILGFRENYFKEAYLGLDKVPKCKSIDWTIFESLGLSLLKKEGIYYTIAMVEDVQKSTSIQNVEPIDVGSIFARVATEMLHNIVLYSFAVLIVVFGLLILSVRRRFFYALNYILFPLGFTLALVSTFYELNIMHLFSLIILIAIGIDYGIYMSKSNELRSTALSIKYSLLSTFAAFGVLLFSSITALYSIGLVISLGVSALFILTKVMR
ncbi:FIG021862: membrane protein, exporter [hydrothermal vent metagenome]|uniref:FIG021862: membrane protein, exporter n=1 Tax=hydrothermal vent metagenome TaxID=652676 RepID=A0A1W1CRJ8_9ZZZZ